MRRAVFAVFRLGAQSTPVVINQQLSTFGMVGLAAGQTARLNAFAVPAGGPVIAGTCQVTFTFYDDSGKSLLSRTLPVAQGAAVHLDLPRGDVSAAADPQDIRGTVRTSFSRSTTAGPATPAMCPVLATEEIFNSSGQVTVVLEVPHALASVLPL